MVSYKLIKILTVIFDIIIFCNGAEEVTSSVSTKENVSNATNNNSPGASEVPEPKDKGIHIVPELKNKGIHIVSKREVPEPEAKGLKMISEDYESKKLGCNDILLKVGLVDKTDTANGLLNYCFVKKFGSYETFKEYANEKIGRVVDHDAGPREMGYFYTIYTQISLAEIEVRLMLPHFFCYIKRLVEIKNEKEKAKKSIWNYIYAKLPPNIFALTYFTKKDENEELSPYDQTVTDCQLSISSYLFVYNDKNYSYDEENPYKNVLTSYEIANLIGSEKEPDGKSLNLNMDDNVKGYFEVHVKQLKDNINKMETFTIPELCKSKSSVNNQKETENGSQLVIKENEASEVLA